MDASQVALLPSAPDQEVGDGANDTTATTPECRICRSGSGLLLRACRCTSLVHEPCLSAWLRARAANTFPALRAGSARECEVCGASCPPSFASPFAKLTAALHSLEGCAALLLLALAVCGHGVYLSAVLRGPQFQGPRAILAAANAVATAALLVLAVRVLARWVRERRFLSAVAAAALPGSEETDSSARVQTNGAAPGVGAQVALGAALSVVAALQVFLLMCAA